MSFAEILQQHLLCPHLPHTFKLHLLHSDSPTFRNVENPDAVAAFDIFIKNVITNIPAEFFHWFMMTHYNIMVEMVHSAKLKAA